MKRWKPFYLLFALLVGCATIVSGPTQTVSVHSSPDSADVWIDGNYEGKTPLYAHLATDTNHVVRVELPGYYPYETKLTKTVNGWVFGNFLLGGILGLVVDLSTGSIYKLRPEQVRAHLKKEKSTSVKELVQCLRSFGCNFECESSLKSSTARLHKFLRIHSIRRNL